MALDPNNWSQLFKNHLASVRTLYEGQLERFNIDSLVIASGEAKSMFLDDQYYHFRANPHFKYWVPLTNSPKSFVVSRPGKKPLLVLYQPKDYWEKASTDIEDFWGACFDIAVVASIEQLGATVKANIVGRTALIGEFETVRSLGQIEFSGMNPKSFIDYLHYHRAVKTDYEMACLRQANRLGVAGHIAAKTAFEAGGSEFDIHLAYLAAAQQVECDLPYLSIVGENENGACLHYRQKSLTRYASGSLHSLLIDAGARFNGYASDITRSYAAYPGEFADLVKAFDLGQQRIVNSVKVGLSYQDLNVQAHGMVAKVLSDFDIVRLDPEAIVERGISNIFLPHGLGHFIGLQVHDAGGHMKDASGAMQPAPEKYPYLRLTRTLEAGHVMTIEPGLYFIDMLLEKLRNSPDEQYVNWAKVDMFRKFGGIRIEDNIILHADRVENMTRTAWAQLEA